jgi:hypothetical protein
MFFCPVKRREPRAGIIFATHVRLSAVFGFRVAGYGFNRLPAVLGWPQKLLMAQGKVHQAYGSAWDKIFTVALPAFIINPAAKGCVITASANFCEKARAEPSLLELCRAEQKSMKVIFRGKARQQG